MLDEIRAKNDMGHALCRNICDGWWVAEYTINRLCLKERTRPLGEYTVNRLCLKERTRPLGGSGIFNLFGAGTVPELE